MRLRPRKGQRLARVLAIAVLFVAPFAMHPIAASADVDQSSSISAIVDPSFVFAVSGLNDGTCNGTAITGTGSTASAVSLGRVDKTTSAVGGQRLDVASNAGGGYSVFAKVDGPLRDQNGNTIANIGNPPSNPGAFVSPGTEGFGYTTDSLLSGGSDRFVSGGAKWAGIDTNDREVMWGANTTNSSVDCIAYQITISKDTVGGYYGNNVTYTAVPTF